MTQTSGSRNQKNWSQDQDETKGFIRKKKEKKKRVEHWYVVYT
jgi:hypothetical protein